MKFICQSTLTMTMRAEIRNVYRVINRFFCVCFLAFFYNFPMFHINVLRLQRDGTVNAGLALCLCVCVCVDGYENDEFSF
jgi:hypothetical protein